MNAFLGDDLLLAALALDGDPLVDGRLRSLPSTEWSPLVERAQHHRVAPLLLHRARSARADRNVPGAPLAAMRQAAARNEARNRQRQVRVEAAVTALGQAGVPSIVLKGTHLLATIYPSPSLRQMWDSDLLVPRGSLAVAETVLLGLGYGPKDRPPIEEDCSWNLHISPFLMPEEGAWESMLEVHWTIEQPSAPFDIDVDGLWNRSREIRVGDAMTRGLGADDLLLHLCLHAGFHHGFDVNLRHIADLAWVVDHRSADSWWAGFVAMAAATRANRIAYVCLAVASELLRIPLTPSMLAELQPHREDVQIIPVVREHIVCAAKKPDPAWVRTRRPLNGWLQLATGMPQRDIKTPESFVEIPMADHATRLAAERRQTHASLMPVDRQSPP